MADLNFQNAKVLGVSQSSNFIGGDVFRLSTTQTIEIEGFIKVPNSDWGTVTQEDGKGSTGNLPSNFDNIQAEIVAMKDAFLADEGFSIIELNDVSIGAGRVVSLDFSSSGDITEDSITFGKYVASIEIYTAASSVKTAYTNDIDIYDESTVNKIESYAINIEDFSESFDFNIAEDDAYNYSHEISVNLRKISDTAFDSKTIAQEIASAIMELSTTLNAKLGYIDNRYKEYLRKIEGTANYSENYDEFQHEYTFSRNLSILSRYTETEFYSAKITHAIAANNFGIINITESGEIKGMKVEENGKYANAKAGMDTEIGESSERCNTIYIAYKETAGITGILFDQKYGEEGSDPESLSPQLPLLNEAFKRAIRTSKRFNSFDGTTSYDVEYTDDPKIGTLSSHQYTLELAKDSSNITTITQRGTIIPYEDRRPDFTRDSVDNPILGPASIYKEATKLEDTPTLDDLLHANGEINTLYKEIEADKLLYKYQMTNSSVAFPKFGVTISYSRTFSDDIAILDPSVNDGIKKLSLSYDNNAPIRMKSNHLIPNIKENVTDSDQISVGERTIAINAIVERDFTQTNKIGKATQDANNGDDAITFQRAKLNTGLTKVIKEAKLNILFLNSTNMPAESYDIYPTSCTYSINSSNQIDFRLGAEYVFKDGRHFSDLDSFFIKETST